MDNSPISTAPAGGPAPSVPVLSPHEAKQWFEFFKVGARREVLLLGEPVEMRVHWHRSKQHKILCTALHGTCALCDIAATDPDVGVQQVEFGCPSYVRAARSNEFLQRVAILPRGACEQILDAAADGCRGRLFEIVRGASNRLQVRGSDKLPREFPSILPPAFDVLPWVRARFGMRQNPKQPLVILPPIKCEGGTGPRPGRPVLLPLTREDVGLDADMLAKFKWYVGSMNGEKPDKPTVEDPAADQTQRPSDDTLDGPLPGSSSPRASAPSTAEVPEILDVQVHAEPLFAEPVAEAAAEPTPRPKPSVTPSPDKAMDALRRRQVHAKPRNEVTAGEAVEFGRVLDHVLPTRPPTIPFQGTNGKHHAKTGGAK